MQIPEQYLPYEFKTFILVCDHLHAKVYQAHGREFNFVQEWKDERLDMSGDTERYQSSTGSQHFAAQDEDFKEREGKLFYHELAKQLFDLKHEQGFEKLILVVPHGDKNVLEEALHDDVKRVLERTIPKQLTKVSEDDLVEAIDKERRV